MKRIILSSIIIFVTVLFSCESKKGLNWQNEWVCEVFPPEHQITEDSVSGTKLVFATSHPGKDLNFYFDLNCWTGDMAMLAFISDRTGRNELFGYQNGAHIPMLSLLTN